MKATRILPLLFIILVASCRNIIIEGQFLQPAEATATALATLIRPSPTSTSDLAAAAAIERAVRLTLTPAPSPTHIPPPFLRAFPEGDFVDGWYWPARERVYLQIHDLVFVSTADSDGYVEFFLAGHDLKQGDVLTMRRGDITVAHTVEQLFVTAISLDTQTLAGTAAGREVVHVWTGGADFKVESDEHGNWLADFSSYDDPALFPGACGGAEAWGDGTSSTIVAWCVPSSPQGYDQGAEFPTAIPPTETPVPPATKKPVPQPTFTPIIVGPFTGTWAGPDPADGSITTLSLVQTANALRGTFSDTYSSSVQPPGYEGSGSGTVLSDTTAQMTFNLARWDDKTLTLVFDLTLSNQNNTMTLSCSICPVNQQFQRQ